MPRRGNIIYWIQIGSTKVNTYRPGLDPPEHAPRKGSLVYGTKDEANAIIALTDCHRFLTRFLDYAAIEESIKNDDEHWVAGVAAKDGDPLPMVRNFLATALKKALDAWNSEQREQVMAALAGLASSTDYGPGPDDDEDLPF